jgi:GTP-binding protein Era
MMHKAGFVNIIGLPNVGKSTLLNGLIGERLSIISPKAQTTRGRLIGLVNQDDCQVVFSDTPGYVNEPAYELHRTMNNYIHEAFEDADVLMLITDKYQSEDEQQFLIQAVLSVEIAGDYCVEQSRFMQTCRNTCYSSTMGESHSGCTIYCSFS